MKTKPKNKLVVIGVDGGTFDILNPLINKGILPNFKKVKNKGILKTVMPPVTAPAWASFSTGNMPNKTEIYEFVMIEEDSWEAKFINRKRLKGKAIWEYLDEANLKSCFINMPLTYPPAKIKGVMISGMETPSERNYVYPPQMKEKLKELGYKIEISALKNQKEDIVKEAIEILDNRLTAARYFLEEDFDFFFVLFRASDIVQHFAWGKEELESVYKKIDQLIGEVLKRPEHDIIILSDHGFERIKKVFNINSWLQKEGYITTAKSKKSLFSVLGVDKKTIYKVLDKLNLEKLIYKIPRRFARKIPTEVIKFEEAIFTNLIDFNKTLAIGKESAKAAQIFFNHKRRGGIVDERKRKELKAELKSKLNSFFKSQKLEAFVKTKEELYGDRAKYAPDITVYLKEKGYNITDSFNKDKKLWESPLFEPDAKHNMDGIILSNLDLNLSRARIIDSAPTILKYFNIPIPKNMDGKPLY